MIFSEEEIQMPINSMRQRCSVAIERLNVSLACNVRNNDYRPAKMWLLILAGQTPSRILLSSLRYITRQTENSHRRESKMR